MLILNAKTVKKNLTKGSIPKLKQMKAFVPKLGRNN